MSIEKNDVYPYIWSFYYPKVPRPIFGDVLGKIGTSSYRLSDPPHLFLTPRFPYLSAGSPCILDLCGGLKRIQVLLVYRGWLMFPQLWARSVLVFSFSPPTCLWLDSTWTGFTAELTPQRNLRRGHAGSLIPVQSFYVTHFPDLNEWDDKRVGYPYLTIIFLNRPVPFSRLCEWKGRQTEEDPLIYGSMYLLSVTANAFLFKNWVFIQPYF